MTTHRSRTLELHFIVALVIALGYFVYRWERAEARCAYIHGKLDAYTSFEAKVPSAKELEKW